MFFFQIYSLVCLSTRIRLFLHYRYKRHAITCVMKIYPQYSIEIAYVHDDHQVQNTTSIYWYQTAHACLTQQTQNICITFAQRRPRRWSSIVQMLYNVLCFTTVVVLIRYISQLNYSYLTWNVWPQIKHSMSNFQPLEVMDRGSETQPQVVENLNKFTWRDNG